RRNAAPDVLPRIGAHREWSRCGGIWGILQALGLEVRSQCIDNFGDITIHDRIEAMQGKADAVVSHPILGVVVWADLLTALTRTHHRPAFISHGFLLLLHLDFI